MENENTHTKDIDVNINSDTLGNRVFEIEDGDSSESPKKSSPDILQINPSIQDLFTGNSFKVEISNEMKTPRNCEQNYTTNILGDTLGPTLDFDGFNIQSDNIDKQYSLGHDIDSTYYGSPSIYGNFNCDSSENTDPDTCVESGTQSEQTENLLSLSSSNNNLFAMFDEDLLLNSCLPSKPISEPNTNELIETDPHSNLCNSFPITTNTSELFSELGYDLETSTQEPKLIATDQDQTQQDQTQQDLNYLLSSLPDTVSLDNNQTNHKKGILSTLDEISTDKYLSIFELE